MSEIVRIPPELQRFLGFPGPQSLLVRGPPGSGKTTLGLACLEEFRGERFLITSRVPQRELGREFPWLGSKSSQQIHVVDTSEMDQSVHDVARTIRTAREAAFAGSGSGTPMRFQWLPAPIREALGQVGAKSAPALFVIDSWDALIEQFLGADGSPGEGPVPDRGYLERLLLRLLAQSPAHLIFILEREEQTQLDYLVNGVILTHREARNERLERWMTILKLRGVRIENPVYPFTLEGSRFMTILPARPYFELRGEGFDAQPDKMPGYLWPGSATFAEVFGRLRFGRVTLIEHEAGVASRARLTLVLPVASQVLADGGRMLAIPPSTSTPEEVYAPFAGVTEKSAFVSQVRLILAPSANVDPSFQRMVAPLARGKSGTPLGATSGAEMIRFLTEGATPARPALLLIDLGGMAGVAASMGITVTPEAAQQIPLGMHAAIRDLPIHAIVIGPAEAAMTDAFRPLATTRIRMWTHQGRIFLHGTEPWTPTLVMTGGRENRSYDLVRIV